MECNDRIAYSSSRANQRWLTVILTAFLLVLSSCAGSESDDPDVDATPASGVAKVKEEPAAESSSTTIATATTSAGATETTEGTPQASSRDNPIAAGTTVSIGDWQVTVLAANPDATEAILAENPYNEPPGRGYQLFTVEVAATYAGDSSDAVFAGLTFTALGDSSVAYDYEAQCGVIPDPLSEFTEVFPGGTIRGNVCWSVLSTDAENLLLIADPAFGFSSDRAFLEIPVAGASFSTPIPGTVTMENGEAGSRINPLPVGTTATIGEWEVLVTGTIADATSEILDSNPFNDPPHPDHQFMTVELQTTYLGAGSDSLFSGLTFASVAASSVAYNYEASCGVFPNELDDFVEVFTGGVITGNLCWSVVGSDLDSLVLIVDPAFGFGDGRVFMAVR